MLRIVIYTILSIFLLASKPYAAPVLEEKSVIIRGNKKVQTPEEIAADLEARKAAAEPFNPKKVKIDVHSLGLDDVEEKAKNNTKNAAENDIDEKNIQKDLPPIAKPNLALPDTAASADNASNNKASDAQNPAATKNSAKEDAQKLLKIIENDKKEMQKKIEEVEKNFKDAPKDASKAGQDKSALTKTNTESTKKDDKSQVVNPAITESEVKKPIEQYLTSNKKQALRQRLEREKVKKNLAKEKLSKQQKQERLEKLRRDYLIKLDEEKSEFESKSDYESDDLVPHEKALPWSEKFLQYDTPPAPLLDRYRGNENKHIPLIASTREKIDLLFSIIATGSESDPAAFHSAYQQILDPNITNEKGETILTFATMLQRYPIMTSILSKGADPDLANSLGHTPLDIAIEMRNLNSCKILIDMNADVNYVDGLNHTYLMRAARVGFFEAVELLVKNGADVNAVDSQGNTALSTAYRYKQEMIAKYLLKNGAKNWAQKPPVSQEQPVMRELENKWKQ